LEPEPEWDIASPWKVIPQSQSATFSN